MKRGGGKSNTFEFELIIAKEILKVDPWKALIAIDSVLLVKQYQ